jgi:hypothetical protein
MADKGDEVSILDREVAAQVLISQPGSSEGCDVTPELVNCKPS